MGPVAPKASATWAAGALATDSVNRKGDTASGESVKICSRMPSVKDDGPKLVASTTAMDEATGATSKAASSMAM